MSIKSIINDKIPEIYKYIDNKVKGQIIKPNEIQYNNNPIKINDGSGYFNNKKINNLIEDFNFNNNKIEFNNNNNSNNNNKIFTNNINENNNFNNNNNSFESNNNNNNINININNKNIDDIADRIEMMGSVKSVNKVFNNNNLNVKENKSIKEFNASSLSHSESKEDDFDRSINKIIKDNKESQSKNGEDFESNFDE